MSTTLGIDLASQPENTAICTIEWAGGAAEVRTLLHGRPRTSLDDAALREQFDAGHAKIAIDAPLGWPDPFVHAVAAHHRGEPWPVPHDLDGLTRRATDRFVRDEAKKLPLSVSTDRIAYCAMRCAALLSGRDEPRDGSGLVVEAYPDAALRCWLKPSFDARPVPTYKGVNARDRRELLISRLLAGLGSDFSIGGFRDACVASDDCLDALLCALVARAAAQNETIKPKTDEQVRLAPTEGWNPPARAGQPQRVMRRAVT